MASAQEQCEAKLAAMGFDMPPPEDGADMDAAREEVREDCMDTLANAGIRFVDAVDFKAKPPPDWEWLIPDFLPKHAKGDLYGKSKQRKTFLALQLAHCLAGGRKFMCWDIPHPVHVVYFNLELIERGLWERMEAQGGKLKLDLQRGRLTLCNLRSNPLELREKAAPLKEALERMRADIAIIDPRYKVEKSGEDTNTAVGMRELLNFRDSLLEACAVLLVGHDPKGEVAGKSMVDRGAGSFTGGADWDFCLTLSPHVQEGYTILSAGSRYRQPPPDMSLLWQPRAQIFEWIEGMPAEAPLPRGGRNPNNRKVFTRDGRADLARKAAEIVKGHDKVCTKTDLLNEVYATLHETDGVTVKTAAAIVETMLGNMADSKDMPAELGIVYYKRGFPKGEFIGTPEQMEAFKKREEQREAEIAARRK